MNARVSTVLNLARGVRALMDAASAELAHDQAPDRWLNVCATARGALDLCLAVAGDTDIRRELRDQAWDEAGECRVWLTRGGYEAEKRGYGRTPATAKPATETEGAAA